MFIWIEKYRPQKLEDVIMPKETFEVLNAMINSNDIHSNFTNIILTGPPGTGKTSVAKLIPKTLNLPYLYINASEESGIDILRNRIKDFSTSQTIDNKLKIVILDEAEGISAQFQAALRNVIESVYKTTRFILTCNYPERIIAPLHSRLKEIVFSKVNIREISKRVLEILKSEKIIIPKEQSSNLGLLIKKYYPDIRKIINHLQYFCSSGTLNIIFNDIVSQDLFDSIIQNIKYKKISEIRNILRNNKLDTDGVIKRVFDEVLNTESQYFNKDFTESKRAETILLCSEYLFKSNFMIDKEINFAAFAIELAGIGI